MPVMPTDALLDVNVLIATVFADHPDHLAGRSFVAQVERFYTSPTTQGGFFRFCNARVEGHAFATISTATVDGRRLGGTENIDLAKRSWLSRR